MTAQKTIPLSAWAQMALLALIWGGSFLSIKLAVAETGVLSTVAIRTAGAAAVLWAVLLPMGYRIPREGRVWGALFVMGLLNNALPFTLITWGQQSIETGLAAILNASTAVFGVLIASLAFRDERLTPHKLLGVGLGFLGVATAIGLSNVASLDLTSLAQLAVLGASLCYALSGSFARLALGGLSPQVAAAGMLTASAAMMVPLALLREGLPPAHHSAGAWAALGYLAVIATALAYLLFYRIIARVGAGHASLVTLMVAPVSILLGTLLLGEVLPLRAYAGFAILAAGLVILDGRLMRRQRPAVTLSEPGSP
jgi:drug/metabolite transporter (DMT)-like permease